MRLGDLAVYYCAAVSVLFIVAYSILAKWWKSDFGKHLFFFMLTVASTFVYWIVVRIFGRFPGWEWFRLGLMLALGVVLTWRVWILVKVQIKGRLDNRA